MRKCYFILFVLLIAISHSCHERVLNGIKDSRTDIDLETKYSIDEKEVGFNLLESKNLAISFKQINVHPLRGILKIRNSGEVLSKHDYYNGNGYTELTGPNGEVIRINKSHGSLVIGEYENGEYIVNSEGDYGYDIVSPFFENPVEGYYTITEFYEGVDHKFHYQVVFYCDPKNPYFYYK